MMMKKAILATGAAFAAMMMASPASAAIYTYTMKGNGGVLTIDTVAKSGTWKSADLDAFFTSDDFANFTGGAKPNFTAILDVLTGTYTVGGKALAPNPKNKFTSHPQKLIFNGTSTVNLWAWWGDPIKAGDYVKHIGSVSVTTSTSSGGTPVSEPGMLGLFALGMMGLWAGNRRRRVTAKGLRPAAA